MSSRIVLPWLLGSSKLHRSRPWPVPPIQLVIRLTETQSKTCPDEELLLRTRHWSYKFVIFVLYVVDEGFLQFAMCLTQGRKQELNEIDMQCPQALSQSVELAKLPSHYDHLGGIHTEGLCKIRSCLMFLVVLEISEKRHTKWTGSQKEMEIP